MKLSEINKSLKNKIAAVKAFPALFVQCGEDAETGPWLKAQFKPGGRTYLFDEETVKNTAETTSNMFAQAGGILLGKHLAEKIEIRRTPVCEYAPSGFISAEFEKISKFLQSLPLLRDIVAEYWNCGMFEAGMLPLDFRRSFAERSFVQDAEPDSTVKTVTESKVLAEWYDMRKYDNNMPVWGRAVPPVMWYGRALAESDSGLDEKTTPFGEITDDVNENFGEQQS